MVLIKNKIAYKIQVLLLFKYNMMSFYHSHKIKKHDYIFPLREALVVSSSFLYSTILNLTYRYPSTPNPTSSLSRNAGPSLLFTNSRIPPPTTSAANIGISTGFEILPIPRYQHPITSPDLPHPYFQFSPLAAPANTGVSLPLQLMKATVLAESYTLYPLSS